MLGALSDEATEVAWTDPPRPEEDEITLSTGQDKSFSVTGGKHQVALHPWRIYSKFDWESKGRESERVPGALD